MKIAIQGHPTRGKEVIQILENLGGENRYDQSGSNKNFIYFINNVGLIYSVPLQTCSNERKIYTLEEFEKEFPFKIGDKVRDCSDDEIGVITGLPFIDNILIYNVDFVNSGQAFMSTEQLKSYKEIKEERNITLTLDKAKKWYKKGGELKEIALQAFTEKELNTLPRSWEEFCKQGNPIASWRYTIPTKYEALFKLEQLRDCWKQDWKPDWNDDKQAKYYICYYQGKFKISTLYETRCFLSFPTREMAEGFLECFKDLIKQAGDLI